MKSYTCGTLSYTKPALVILFFWLLWGDVCYTLMESVTWPIMKLKFQSLDARNWEVALILSTIPGFVYSFFIPVISFKSDRYRSRWGRRIPFILFSMPFLVLLLVGLAFGDRLGFWLYGFLHLPGVSANKVAIWTLGGMLIIFTFFNTFVTSTFWYLFNDVVPQHLLARFMGWFRVIGTLSAALYNFYIFPYSGSHSTAVFLGAAALYLFGFGLMCLNVREGEYPPAPPYVGGGKGPIAMMKTYGKECHSHKIYWYLWLCTFIGSIGGGVGLFDLYFKQAIGLDLLQIGQIAGAFSIVMAVLFVGAGWLADRYHPIRVVLVAQIIGFVLVTPATMIWLFWHPAPGETWTLHLPFLQYLPYLCQYADFAIQKVFLISVVIYVGISAPIAALIGMWDPVLLMRTFPRSRVGQFCSTNAVWRTIGGMIGGVLAGSFLDILTPIVGKERAYYYSPVWSAVFCIPSFFLFVKFYQQWKELGGDESYMAPVPGEETPAELAAEAILAVQLATGNEHQGVDVASGPDGKPIP